MESITRIRLINYNYRFKNTLLCRLDQAETIYVGISCAWTTRYRAGPVASSGDVRNIAEELSWQGLDKVVFGLRNVSTRIPETVLV